MELWRQIAWGNQSAPYFSLQHELIRMRDSPKLESQTESEIWEVLKKDRFISQGGKGGSSSSKSKTSRGADVSEDELGQIKVMGLKTYIWVEVNMMTWSVSEDQTSSSPRPWQKTSLNDQNRQGWRMVFLLSRAQLVTLADERETK